MPAGITRTASIARLWPARTRRGEGVPRRPRNNIHSRAMKPRASGSTAPPPFADIVGKTTEPRRSSMSVVAMINEKGGVGKTSSCMHLGGAIARRGLRVMLVDNDPQCSLTKGLLGNEAARGLDPATTLYALYDELPMDADDLIRPTEFEGLSLLAGSAAAKRFNVPEPHLLPFDEQARLREGLRPLAAGFDITIIDSCPNLQYCTWSGLLAADAAIIPTQPELYGAQGLAEVRDWLALVAQSWGRP